ncbi:uncharacterized protein KRP23_13342 [Phytophthora ramorum]|uniref:uncharacterized protein n=1 Tax=Phytophthora ramorum TaxID=164328 RepID=UPI00309B14D5|nr:hypothetical protein KRP23_13342 [Phytophthora ramorum]
MLVLVDVEEAAKSRKHLYRYGKQYRTEMKGIGKPLHTEPVALQECEEVAEFVHKAHCDPLWVTSLHSPHKPWRRVFFKEVQELVLLG